MIYLDNAATTFPKPNRVYDKVLECMKEYAANPGRGSYNMSIKAATQVNNTRQKISNFFNMNNVLNVIFTSNATESLNIGIKGVLKKGDHVITTVTEHNSVLRPLNRLSRQGIEFTIIGIDDGGEINVKNLKKQIKKNTRLIVVNHVSNVTGIIQPIKEISDIAKENDILFMVDASQSAGVIDIDMKKLNIDILACAGHKGLLGPQGTGILCIKDTIQVNSLKEGGTGSNSNLMVQPDFLPDKLESGTLNVPGICGLGEAISFINSIGIENISKSELKLTSYLIEELSKLDYIKIYPNKKSTKRSSVVSFNMDNKDSSTVGFLLNQENIAVRTGYHCASLIHGAIGTNNKGTVRVSPGYFNKLSDIDKLIESLMKIYKY